MFDLKQIHILFSLRANLFRMCTQSLYVWVERMMQASAPPLPLHKCAGEKWKTGTMVGRGEERRRKLMSQYKQRFLFVMAGCPATVKLRDVHLGHQGKRKHYVSQDLSACVDRVQGSKM